MMDRNEKIENLKSRLERMQGILDFARVNIEITSFLHYWGDGDYAEIRADNVLFFDAVEISCRRIAAIELYKLSSKSENDKFSFNKLFEDLKLFGEAKMEKAKILELENKIESKNSEFSDIKTLRNKKYAHSDINFKQIINDNTKVKSLIIMYQEILKEIVEKFDFKIYSKILPQDINSYSGMRLFNNILLGKHKI